MSIKHMVLALGIVAMPSWAMAQGTVQGAANGADAGGAAAGPVGAVVGGAVGAATGTVGGVLGVGAAPPPCGTRSVTRSDSSGNSETRTTTNCP